MVVTSILPWWFWPQICCRWMKFVSWFVSGADHKLGFASVSSLQHGNGAASKEAFEVPDGWQWISEWIVDINRAVDEDGKFVMDSILRLRDQLCRYGHTTLKYSNYILSRLYQGCTNFVSRLYQGCSKFVSRLSQGCIKVVPRSYRRCPKVVPSSNQGCTKVVSRLYKGCREVWIKLKLHQGSDKFVSMSCQGWKQIVQRSYEGCIKVIQGLYEGAPNVWLNFYQRCTKVLPKCELITRFFILHYEAGWLQRFDEINFASFVSQYKELGIICLPLTNSTSPCCLSGWEYTVDSTVAGYVAVEKTYHLSRRRRWVRSRTLVSSTEKEDKVTCFVLFCSVLFCCVVFCFVPFCSAVVCFVLLCIVLLCFVLFCFLFFYHNLWNLVIPIRTHFAKYWNQPARILTYFPMNVPITWFGPMIKTLEPYSIKNQTEPHESTVQ